MIAKRDMPTADQEEQYAEETYQEKTVVKRERVSMSPERMDTKELRTNLIYLLRDYPGMHDLLGEIWKLSVRGSDFGIFKILPTYLVIFFFILLIFANDSDFYGSCTGLLNLSIALLIGIGCLIISVVLIYFICNKSLISYLLLVGVLL